jgi:hypothetical protein
MYTIFKFEILDYCGVQEIIVPGKHCEVLSTNAINGQLFVWVKFLKAEEDGSIVNFSSSTRIQLEIFGTGWEIPMEPSRKFIGTAVDLNTNFVWHVFQRTF